VDREQDILQIRKYLKGELNARAMHELERRALDDPFLMDALEGFERSTAEQDANLAELTNRLHQRTEKSGERIVPWIPLSAAASILVVLGVGIWFFTNTHDDGKAKSALVQNIVTGKKEKPDVSAPARVPDTLQQQKSYSIAQAAPDQFKANAIKREKKEDTSRVVMRELSVAKSQGAADVATVQEYNSPVSAESAASYDKNTGYFTPKKDSVGANEMLVNDLSKKKKANPAAVFKPKIPQPTQTLVQSKVDGVSVNADNSRTVSGTVMGNGGIPITGATVKVIGRNFGAVTDANGKFILSDVAKSQTLSVNYIGYSGKKIKADKDSMSISLEPANSSLAEVVVTRAQTEKSVKAEDAHPHDGWNAFDDYLKKNALSPDGKTGKVKLTFVVAADGSLSQFKITRGISDDADKKAISLISSGPAWVGGSDGKPKEITVTVKFH
jgi:hypothetical protein